jgi:cysteinyl-tRNA synthetase
MSEAHLGLPFDIHGGGQDLIFPHHENEVAQSVSAHDGAEFVRYWVHNGYLTVEGEKMAKSLGNYYTVHELLEAHPGEAIRFYMLKTHYRQPLDFTKEGLAEARAELDRFYGALRKVVDVRPSPANPSPASMVGLLNDLNTPLAISHLHRCLGPLNEARDHGPQVAAKTNLLSSAEILGLLQQDPEDWFRWQPATGAAIDEAEIAEMVTARSTARADGDFVKADQIRHDLRIKYKIILEDRPDGTTDWRRAG